MKRVNYYENFFSMFDTETGEYMRTGMMKKPNIHARDLIDTGVDPFMVSFPELLDVGIMGHCKHGALGLCVKACRVANIVPNFTTSGLGMTPELASLCKNIVVRWR